MNIVMKEKIIVLITRGIVGMRGQTIHKTSEFYKLPAHGQELVVEMVKELRQFGTVKQKT